MADEKEKKEAEAPKPEGAPKKSKLPMLLGGGVGALLLCAYLFATMAVPKAAVVPKLQGPFVCKLSNSELTVNLAGENSKRYLVMDLTGEYVAYGEAFVQTRTGAGGKPGSEDSQYLAMLMDRLLSIASTRTREEVIDPVMIDALLEQIRQEIEPVLFPILIGDVPTATAADAESGLKAGESIHRATMRGLLHDHHLTISAIEKTIRLDNGPVLRFEGDERDLELVDPHGKTLYIDVTGLHEDFEGEVPVGVAGRLRRLLRQRFMIQ
ncbi:MAG: flagellar basal body-associated FliL family protein [Planctomycetes bacterium]|nr:flagellar basal body-associated FliL family protein [Planctomycetota bacterium]